MNRVVAELQNKNLRGRLRFLFKDSLIYGGAKAMARMVNIFTLPIIARALSEADYGVYDGLRVISNVSMMMLLVGLDQSASIMSFNFSKKLYRKGLFGHALLLVFLISVAITPLMFYWSKDLMNLYFDASSYQDIFRYVIISIPFMVIHQFSQSMLKWNYKRMEFLIVTVGFIIFFFCYLIILYFLGNINLESIFLGYLISYLIFSLMGLFLSRKLFILNLKWKYTLSLLLFGLPFFIDSSLTAFIPALDRYFIANKIGLSQLAIYAVAFRITSLLRLPMSGFQVAWGPFAMSLRDTKNASQTFSLVLVLFGSFMILLAALITVNSNWIITLFVGDGYSDASSLFLPLTFGIVISSFTIISGYGLIMSGKTYLNTASYVVQIISLVLLISLLINHWGILGVAYAVLLSQIILFILRTFFSTRYYTQSPKLFVPLLIVVLGYAGIFLLFDAELSIIYKNTILFLLLVIFGYLAYQHRAYFKKH